MALEALKGEQTMAELAERFDVHPNQTTPWKTQLLERSADVFGGEESKEPPVDVKALHAKIGELTLEVDFLGSALTKAYLDEHQLSLEQVEVVFTEEIIGGAFNADRA